MIDPLSVPKAITETGTLASAARCAASCSVRPTVRLPSVISTIRAGGGPASLPSTGPGSVLENRSMVCRQEMIASPVAVRSSSVSPAMACLADRPVGGRADQHGGDAGERDDAQVDPRGQVVDELGGRLLRRGQPVRARRRWPPSTATRRWPASRWPGCAAPWCRRSARPARRSAAPARPAPAPSAGAATGPAGVGATVSSSSRLANRMVCRRVRRCAIR